MSIAILSIIEIVGHMQKRRLSAVIGFAIVIVVCAIVSSTALKDSSFQETVYRVEIDDNVSFNDVCNRYQIIDQVGNTYLVKQKS
jgi:hypothetical protein